jgi:CRP-like cAMP-binding protein
MEDFHEDKRILNISVENFLKIAKVKKDLKSLNDGIKATPKFYIGRYEKAGYITKGQSIGNLTKDIHDDNNTYICLDNCDIVHINKKAARMRTLHNLIIEKKRRILSNLKNNFLIFNLVNEKYFNNEIIPFFEYKQFHKGEKIFIQGSTYEGIYLITEGEVEIYLNSSVNEIGNSILNVKNTLNSFDEYYSDMNETDDSRENGEPVKPKIVKDKTNLDAEKAELLNKNQKFSLLKISKYSIFGTNELYDYKTGIFFFSAECVSKEAIIYFLPKKFFYASFVREKPIYLSLAKMVEFRVRDMIGRLKNHIVSFDKYIEKKYKNTFSKKTLINNQNSFMKSLKIIKKRNINETITKLTKRNEESPFPLLLKDKNISLVKEYNNRNAPIGTISNTFREKIHITLRDKVFNQYKKIKKPMSHQNPKIVNLYNRKIKLEGRGLNISVKNNNKINNFNAYLPSNFPFSVQNSYYNTTPRKRMQNYSFLNHIVLKCK